MLYQEESRPSMGGMPSHLHTTKTGKEKGDAASASYKYRGFPAHLAGRLERSRSINPEKLLAELKKYDVPYTGLGREKFCMLCLALIEQGIAPGLLGLRSSVNRATGLSPEQMDESNDRQVLDLYWFYKKYRDNLNPPNGKMQTLLRQETFDFALASEIVTSMKRTADKLKHLGATPSMQAESFVLKSREVATLSKIYAEKSRRLEVALRERALRRGSKLKIESIPQIMNQLRALDFAGGSPAVAATFWSHMTGSEVNQQLIGRISKRRDWFSEEFGVIFEERLSKLAAAGLSNEECQHDVEERQKWHDKKALIESFRA